MADDRPLLSLVIVSRGGGDDLLASVESFAGTHDKRFEIIVSAQMSGEIADQLRHRFPSVRVERATDPHSIPELRAAGIRAARGEIVAMTTGWCGAGENWVDRVRRAHNGRADVVGGAIEYAGSERAVSEAVFFCEYGRYEPPFERGASNDLPGQNVSYTRAAIEEISPLIAAGRWEPLWHWHLHARGFRLVRDASVKVRMARTFTLGKFWSDRYHYSRAFAGQRLAARSWLARVLYAAATPVLPALLIGRFVRQILATRRRRRERLRLMPYILLFTIPWAAGECVGYLCGPGSSAARID